MNKRRISLIITSFLLIAPNLSGKKSTTKKVVDMRTPIKLPQKTTAPQITIWVHGTSMQPISKYLHACSPGLCPASSLQKNSHAYKIARGLSKADPINFPLEHIHFYGWSGKLSFNERKKVAEEFYQSLCDLIETYSTKHDITPYVRIITHSHGGNVALNLAAVHEREKKNVQIDELILLACPVQHATAPFITHELFKKKYTLYSATDMMQILDPQGLYPHDDVHISPLPKKKKRPLFSERLFAPHSTVVQSSVHVNGRSLFHLEFILPLITKALPRLIHELDQCCAQDTTKNKEYSLHLKT